MPRIFKSAEEFRKPFCPRMHFKPEVGVSSDRYDCWICAMERRRFYDRRRKHREAKSRPPQYQFISGIRDTRKYLGLSVPQFAKLLGVSYQSVYSWERGNARIRNDTVERIIPILSRLKQERIEEVRAEQAQRATSDRHQLTGYGKRKSYAA